MGMRASSRSKLSFRQALAWAGMVVLASLVAMGLGLGVGLRRADRLLDQLSRSQAQMAQAARIQADVNAFVADPTPAAAASVRFRLADYQNSIVAEGEAMGRGGAASPHQADEASRARRISQMFERIAAEPQVSKADLEQFRGLTAEVQTSEQEEAAVSLATMDRLRAVAVVVAVGVPTAVVLLGAVGFVLLTAGVVRPLRRLERATEGLGRERPGTVVPAGFEEFRRLAMAFNRMGDQIARQRQALFDANHDLERQVRERTREIEDSRQRLADVDQARRLFLSKVSHELRTPATVVRGEAEVALRDPAADDSRLREALEHVVANGAFLQRRLDDLLTLARAEDGRLTVRHEAVDLAALARQVARLAESYVRSSDVALEVDLPAGRGPSVIGDASWLQQALLALLDNAAKFAGGTTVRLSLRREDDQAVFVVADGGAGVAVDELPHLFDRYYQTEQGRDRGGAGLGLSVAKWVVEQHDGAIAARGGQGGGLTIEIRLPITETVPA